MLSVCLFSKIKLQILEYVESNFKAVNLRSHVLLPDRILYKALMRFSYIYIYFFNQKVSKTIKY